MRVIILLLLVFNSTLFLSCNGENTLADDLVGEWSFSDEEVFSSKFGSTTFNSDKTGMGTSFVIHPTIVDFKWELINGEQNLKISEENWGNPSEGITTYAISRVDQDNFRLEVNNIVINLTRK